MSRTTATSLLLLAIASGSFGCDADSTAAVDADTIGSDIAVDATMPDVSDASADLIDDVPESSAALPALDPAVGFPVDYTDPDVLAGWMRAADYRMWSFDSGSLEIEETGGSRRIFWNDTLAGSMASGAPRHPVGSVGVRENVHADGSVSSFSILIRVSDSAGPNAWLYYELFDPDVNDDPLVHEVGAPGCVGCHQRSERDFVFEPDADPFVACRPTP